MNISTEIRTKIKRALDLFSPLTINLESDEINLFRFKLAYTNANGDETIILHPTIPYQINVSSDAYILIGSAIFDEIVKLINMNPSNPLLVDKDSWDDGGCFSLTYLSSNYEKLVFSFEGV
ncbi:hypothetical protein [Flavobacterium alkalisoli]|uniref:hypothetical protein n=1 Tax=Flavobacterium alkalisoli TaxID=2602769 RepID=UPI003A8FA3AD